MPAPYHSVFTGRMSFLPPNQQRQSNPSKGSAVDEEQHYYAILHFSHSLTNWCLIMPQFTAEFC